MTTNKRSEPTPAWEQAMEQDEAARVAKGERIHFDIAGRVTACGKWYAEQAKRPMSTSMVEHVTCNACKRSSDFRFAASCCR